MSRRPSAYYVGRQPGVLIVLVALLGYLVLRALFVLTDFADRAYAEMGRPDWSDVIGGLLFIPVAFLIVVTFWLGQGRLMELLGWVS